ncbi:Phenoxybenzoate dioxygenase subunit beta [Sulfitobacter sp. THAF37]|uniref:PDR/VanB family oxidoreductase n=1 Tax=Sulfitobacter sp. THAF37 TaxID=2587855 RepID=UPI001268B3F9|nr:PDR/VanB family oxidoreductase [Sulfitobacter sp. THAF37]QFT58824.1 Phenoxybenzoate dioxygenase subunit beta [Sulfitobacter sp. THAF37]
MDTITGKIVDVTPLTDRISSFRIAAADGARLPGYAPGAHVRVTVADGETRAYSLVDFTPPTQAPESYVITVQREDDGQGGSRHMHGLAAGNTVTLAPPRNDFPLDDGNAGSVLLAGGIGVTPMISMATALADRGRAYAFHYAGRSRGMMAYVDVLEDQHGEALRVHCDDDPDTTLDLDAVIASVDAEAHLYVCGPRGMIDAARAKAEAAGMSNDRIHFELFENAAPQVGDTPFEVEIASTGEVHTVAADQSIIEALEAAGIDVIYDCQRGDCGICQCDVISGEPDHRDVVLSAEERASGKVMQICVSRAKSPRLVLDI